MRARPVLAAALAAVLAFGLGACASTPVTSGTEAVPISTAPLAELELLDDPHGYQGGSTAVLADRAIEPVAENPEQALPAAVVSHDLSGDVDVNVVDTSRVVAMDMAGSIAATVWGLGFGDTLVGRDVSTTFTGSEDLPVVTGSGHTINTEAVIALKPTLVITDSSIGPNDVVTQLRDVGITVVFIRDSASLEGAVQMARDVAAIFGVPEAGELLATRTQGEIDATVAEIAAIAPSEGLRMVFLYLRGASGVYYLFGSESGADELIEAVGGVDVAGELGWGGMRPLTDEAMVAADPDLILVMTSGLASVGGVDGLIQAKPAIALTTAGQNHRIVDMADGDVLSFGPRSADVLDALARAVYAPDVS